jgi:hypothetical protein
VSDLPPIGATVTFRRASTSRLNSIGRVVGHIEGFALVEHRSTDRFGGSRVHTDRIPAHRILATDRSPA